MPSFSTIAIGVIVAVVSSAAQSVGLTLQRKAHLLDESASPLLRKPQLEFTTITYKKNLWRAGLALFLLANVLGSTIQITTLPLIILLPLQAIGLVFNAVFATVFLHEPFTQLTLFGTLLVSLGAFLMAVFGGTISLHYGLDEAVGIEQLWELFCRRQFLWWFGLSMVGVIALLQWVYLLHRRKRRALYSCTAGLALHSRFDNSSIEAYNFRQGLAWGILSGILLAHLLLFAKNSVEIITSALFSRKLLLVFTQEYAVTWVFAGLFVGFAVAQLVTMNQGLKKISTSVYYPLIFCNYNLVNVFNGLIFYNQLSALMAGRRGWVLLGAIGFGVIVVILGVCALSWSRLEEPEMATGQMILMESNPKLSLSQSLRRSFSRLMSRLVRPNIAHASSRGVVADTTPAPYETVYIGGRTAPLVSDHALFSTPIASDDEEYSQFVSFGSPIDAPVMICDVSMERDSELYDEAGARGGRSGMVVPVMTPFLPSPQASDRDESAVRDELEAPREYRGHRRGHSRGSSWGHPASGPPFSPFRQVSEAPVSLGDETTGILSQDSRPRRVLSFEQAELLKQF